MANKDYLNQISSHLNTKPKKTINFMSPKILGLLGGVIVIIILIVVFSALMGSQSRKTVSLLEQVAFRSSNLSTAANKYGNFLKAGKLRSLNGSLSGVLSETNKNVTNVLVSDFSVKDAKAIDKNQKLKESETAYITEVNNKLEKARLNGLLDRTYAREMALEIMMLMSLEKEAAARTKKEAADTVLLSSIQSLENLYVEFSDFSETGK